MELKLSPLAPKTLPVLKDIEGVEIFALECNIKYVGRPDVLFVKLPENTVSAGVFTLSSTRSYTVDWSKEAIAGGVTRSSCQCLACGMKRTTIPRQSSRRITAELLSLQNFDGQDGVQSDVQDQPSVSSERSAK